MSTEQRDRHHLARAIEMLIDEDRAARAEAPQDEIEVILSCGDEVCIVDPVRPVGEAIVIHGTIQSIDEHSHYMEVGIDPRGRCGMPGLVLLRISKSA